MIFFEKGLIDSNSNHRFVCGAAGRKFGKLAVFLASTFCYVKECTVVAKSSAGGDEASRKQFQLNRN